MAAARELRHADVELTVLDRTNHYLFQPLLYQVATGVLSPADIAVPTRFLLRKQRNAQVLLANVDRIDLQSRTVVAEQGALTLPFDYQVVATGARHSYFGHPEWEAVAPGLKTLDDAREIRRRFLMALERAEQVDDPAEQAAWLTVVIIGGGPPGSSSPASCQPSPGLAFARISVAPISAACGSCCWREARGSCLRSRRRCPSGPAATSSSSASAVAPARWSPT